MSQKFISLIGAGRWGQNLLRDLERLGVLHSVCETSPTLVKKHTETYPKMKFIDEFRDLVNYPEVTAVVIATPATTHYQMVKECLLMGYHVMCEKPLALKYAEGQELVDLAKKQNRKLMVGHLLQYHQVIDCIKSMIVEGKIGRIQYIKSNRLNLGQVRTGENVLWSFAPHDISVILSLLDDQMPERVSCSGFATLNPPICDTTTTILHFKNQYAEINVNWLYPYKEQTLIIVGDSGMITFKDSRLAPVLHYYPQPVTYDEDGMVVLNKKEPEVINFMPGDVIGSGSPLEMECRHFIECCQNEGMMPKTDGEEALRVLGVLEMAQKSLESGGIPMKMKDLQVSRYYVHPTAIVEEGAEIGDGTKVWHQTHLMKCRVGRNCSFGQGVYVGKDVVMGDDCRVQNNVNIYSGVICESGVFFGPNCTTTNDKNPRAEFSKGGKYVPTYIKHGSTIGAGAVIVCGVTLGKYCLVGAGAVVTKDVPDYAVVVGNPAKVIGQVDEHGEISYPN